MAGRWKFLLRNAGNPLINFAYANAHNDNSEYVSESVVKQHALSNDSLIKLRS